MKSLTFCYFSAHTDNCTIFYTVQFDHKQGRRRAIKIHLRKSHVQFATRKILCTLIYFSLKLYLQFNIINIEIFTLGYNTYFTLCFRVVCANSASTVRRLRWYFHLSQSPTMNGSYHLDRRPVGQIATRLPH